MIRFPPVAAAISTPLIRADNLAVPPLIGPLLFRCSAAVISKKYK
jgi:hypothetical protein